MNLPTHIAYTHGIHISTYVHTHTIIDGKFPCNNKNNQRLGVEMQTSNPNTWEMGEGCEFLRLCSKTLPSTNKNNIPILVIHSLNL